MGRKYEVTEGKIKLTNTTETIFDSRDIEMQLQHISKEKLKLLEQNRMIHDRYNALLAEEEQLKQIVAEAGSSRLPLIDPNTGDPIDTGGANV